MRSHIVCLAAFGCLCAQGQDVSRDISIRPLATKDALVIANESYLKSPRRSGAEDGRQVAQALTENEFRVDLIINANRRSLETEIDKFVAQIKAGDVVFVYYNGHAVQISGENYLLPVDFDAKDLTDAKYLSYSAGRLAERIEGAGASICVLVLDAASANGFGLTEIGKRGLAPMNLGGRTYIAISSAPGTNSVELQDSKMSLFGGFFVDALRTPNLTLDQLFNQVRTKVYEATNGAQVPVVSIGGDSSYMLRPSANAVQPTETGAFEKELKAWTSIRDSREQQPLQDFVSRFPNGSFAESVNGRLQSLMTSVASSILPNPNPSSKSNTNPNMAKPPEREGDPNFDFTEIEWEFLSQSDALDRKFEREGMVLNDPDLEAYVNRVGRSILPSAAPLPNVKWNFRVLRDPVPNAFALANGSVYVNSGLLSILDNESQLASVLAHEITHVTGRHGFRANRSYRKKALTASIFQMAGNYAPGNSIWGASIKLAGAAMPVVMQASILGYERELERQADLFALEKLSQTGYDPREMANAFRHLDEKPEVELQTIYYSDHPKLQDRINYVNQYLTEHKVDDSALFPAQAAQYRSRTANALRVDALLAVMADRRRTAHVIAKRLVDWDPAAADNLVTLADTYKALGPWTAQPTPEELSAKGKKDEKKAKSKFTPAEEEERYRSSPQAQEILRDNVKHATDIYEKVLALDPSRYSVYKSLGQAYESVHNVDSARGAYEKYIAATSDTTDAERVKRRMANLSEGLEQGKKGR